MEQRRHFSRVLFETEARLQSGEQQIGCKIHDLSLRGALIIVSDPAAWSVGQACTLTLRLDADHATSIQMEGTVAHIDGSVIGVHCERIDLDSITHLRRLVELNVGDEALLQRELSALTRS